MDQKAFDLITAKVGEALEALGCQPAKNMKQEEDGKAAVFLGDGIAYSVIFRESRKRFELRSCGMEGDEPDGKWKGLSMWLFDPENDGTDQAQSIANDFVETLQGPKQTAIARSKKKRRKDDDNNVDTVFFFNRFVGLFPELKNELADERALYGDGRPVTFARQKLLPKVEALCAAGTDKNAIGKACGLFCEMYVSGDMDVRSIITIVILNGLSAKALENLQPLFTTEMAKGFKSAHKMKGKNVKPEKVKKSRKIMAETLNQMGNH